MLTRPQWTGISETVSQANLPLSRFLFLSSITDTYTPPFLCQRLPPLLLLKDSSPLYRSVLLTLAEVRLHVGIHGQTYAADRVCFSPVQPVPVVPDLVCTTAPPLQDELKVMTPRSATQVPAVSSSCLTFIAQITSSAVFNLSSFSDYVECLK